MIKPYKDKIANIRAMMNRNVNAASTTFHSVTVSPKRSLNYNLNLANYNHMSRLRNAVSLFSIKATADRLVEVMDKYKELFLGIVKSQMTKRQLWPVFVRSLEQLEAKQ